MTNAGAAAGGRLDGGARLLGGGLLAGKSVAAVGLLLLLISANAPPRSTSFLRSFRRHLLQRNAEFGYWHALLTHCSPFWLADEEAPATHPPPPGPGAAPLGSVWPPLESSRRCAWSLRIASSIPDSESIECVGEWLGPTDPSMLLFVRLEVVFKDD